MQKALSGPLQLQRRMGGRLDAAAIAAAEPDRLAALFQERPALHRFPGAMAGRVQALCAAIVRDYGGDAGRIWTDARDGADLKRRLLALPAWVASRTGHDRDGPGARFGLRQPAGPGRGPAAPSDAGRCRFGRGARQAPGGKRAYKASLRAGATPERS